MNLEGKIIAFLGDSITEGVGVADIANNRYDHVLARECNLKKTYNYGIGGSRLAHQSRASDFPRWDLCFCGRAYNIENNVDLVVVYGGVNDYLHGDAPFGSIGDTTPNSFCGGVFFLMNTLKEKFISRGIPVVFMTPACCTRPDFNDLQVSTHPNKKADAKPLLSYVEVIQKTAEQFQIPVLHLYNNLGIDPKESEDCKQYTADGLHFNDAGQYVLAQKLKAFLQAL